MKRAMIILAVLAVTSFGARPGYSQYATYVGVPGAAYTSYYGGYYGGAAPVYGSYASGLYGGGFGGYYGGGYAAAFGGGFGGYMPGLYNSYGAGFGGYAPNVLSIASPGMVTPDVLVISRGGYGTYVGAPSIAAPMAASYYGNPLPFVPDSFMGTIESFRPWAVYTRYSPY